MGGNGKGAVGGVQKKTNCHASFLMLPLLQLPLVQGRWASGVEEGVENIYGRGRVCGSGGGSHRGRLRLAAAGSACRMGSGPTRFLLLPHLLIE